ncbi:class I SAM-dependent methyltransferase [Kordia jejudonensis]|uniref:class I SAM-dependent methyltransferase n=1 Tax=Kordia jejudonensis TaxID=1348245 RepID=UPI0006291A01|nr:class I SAM-dependent methyltransferase [Kordia jejudonensis]
MRKSVNNQDQWAKVLSELEEEYAKLQSYDKTIIEHLGDVRNIKVLDYGAGPAVLADLLQNLGAQVKVYDISKEMREIAVEKLGRAAVIDRVNSIPKNYFDIILCNLVVCIVAEEEVYQIIKNLRSKIASNGKIYIGFCNPKIYDIKESNLDYRFPIGEDYSCNHDYKKVKKEGNYEIIERHRSIEWYTKVMEDAGLEVSDVFFTPEYELKGFKIRDFIIFELTK